MTDFIFPFSRKELLPEPIIERYTEEMGRAWRDMLRLLPQPPENCRWEPRCTAEEDGDRWIVTMTPAIKMEFSFADDD